MMATVSLRVKLGGGLAAQAGTNERAVTVPDTTTLRQVAELAGVSPALVMLYAVNGVVRPPSSLASDGDEVTLIPAVSGG
jgi:molybdopterin converting factor small subunit